MWKSLAARWRRLVGTVGKPSATKPESRPSAGAPAAQTPKSPMSSAQSARNGDPSASLRKSVIVTGGASGIGLAMVRHFAGQGHLVAILDVNGAGAQIASDLAAEFPEATVTFKQCDVSSWEDQAVAFQAVYEEHGAKLDVVMANAGISEQGVTTAISLDEQVPSKPKVKSVDINLYGVIYSSKLAVHYMNKKPMSEHEASRGSIICTASNAGLYPFPTAPLYAASKFAVIGFVRSMGMLLEKSRIQVNGLAPAVLVTNIAPDKSLFNDMIVTPMSTLIKGVETFIQDPKRTGQIAEIHGSKVTVRPQHEFVDQDTEANLKIFYNLGFA